MKKEHMENNVANPLQEEPEKEQMKPASQSDINKSNSELSSNGVVSLATKTEEKPKSTIIQSNPLFGNDDDETTEEKPKPATPKSIGGLPK